MRDLNIPRIDEVPDVSAGEGLFSTDVNSQSALSYANGAEQTVLDPTKANANPTIDPAFIAYLMESQKNVAPSNTTLPPNYYYPDANRGVTVGQMSGPLGSMSLITPGAPLFPMSVMDAVEKEEKAAKAKYVEDGFKKIDYDFQHLDQPSLDYQFQLAQIVGYSGLEAEYLKKAGNDPTLQRKLMQQDGVLQKEATKWKALKSNFDRTYKEAVQIDSDAKDKTKYVNPTSLALSRQLLQLTSAGNFVDNMDKITEVRDKLQTTLSAEVAGENLIHKISQSILEKQILEPVFKNSGGTDEEYKTNIVETAQRLKSTGLTAFTDEELDKMIRAEYDYQFGSLLESDEYAVIPYKQFKEVIINSSLARTQYDAMNISKDISASLMAYKKSLEYTTIQPATEVIGGKDVYTVGYSTDLPLFDVGGTMYKWINPQNGRVMSGNRTAKVIGQSRSRGGVTMYLLAPATDGKVIGEYTPIWVPSNKDIDAAVQYAEDQYRMNIDWENPVGQTEYGRSKTFGGSVEVDGKTVVNKPAGAGSQLRTKETGVDYKNPKERQ